MTTAELIKELQKVPDQRAEVSFANMEYDGTVPVHRVVVETCSACLPQYRYKVVLK